jgi:hypothetical protein
MRMAASQFTTAASGIVAATSRPVVGGDDLPAQFVAMIEARAAFGADIAVVKVADRMTKSLLDILV